MSFYTQRVVVARVTRGSRSRRHRAMRIKYLTYRDWPATPLDWNPHLNLHNSYSLSRITHLFTPERDKGWTFGISFRGLLDTKKLFLTKIGCSLHHVRQCRKPHIAMSSETVKGTLDICKKSLFVVQMTPILDFIGQIFVSFWGK